MFGRRIAAVGAALVLVGAGALSAGLRAGATGPAMLSVPAGTAFAVLGHSCGGIQEQSFATGFDGSGSPAGEVYLQTRCGGSGRGGGYHVTTYSAWVSATWDFSARLSSYSVGTTPATLPTPGSITDLRGDALDNVLNAVNVAPANCTPSNVTYCSYRAYLTVALPGQPTGVTVAEANDALTVAWLPAGNGGPATSTTVTAVPGGGAATLTATVASGASATLPGVAPSTTYSITVTASNSSGSGSSSTAVLFTSPTASTVPGVPTGLVVAWHVGGTILHAAWSAAPVGDSPTDDYQVQIARHDPTGPPVSLDAGTATSLDSSAFRSADDWSVSVRAHNTAGWGAWTKARVLPAY